MKKILLLFIISFIFIPKVYAKQIIEETHMESVIMLDVARRYYTVDEIKKYIDALSLHDNPFAGRRLLSRRAESG